MKPTCTSKTEDESTIHHTDTSSTCSKQPKKVYTQHTLTIAGHHHHHQPTTYLLHNLHPPPSFLIRINHCESYLAPPNPYIQLNSIQPSTTCVLFLISYYVPPLERSTYTHTHTQSTTDQQRTHSGKLFRAGIPNRWHYDAVLFCSGAFASAFLFLFLILYIFSLFGMG